MKRKKLFSRVQIFSCCFLLSICITLLCAKPVKALSYNSEHISYSTDGNISPSGDQFSVTGGLWWSTDGAITINNVYSGQIAIKISYTSVSGTVKINGTSVSGSGTTDYIIIDQSKSIEISITGTAGFSTSSITISSIESIPVTTVNVGFAKGVHGSYAVSGVTDLSAYFTDSENDLKRMEVNSLVGLTVNASSPESDYEFFAWVMDIDGKNAKTIVSLDSSATLTISDAGVLYPVYVPVGQAMYSVNRVYYDSWDAAFKASAALDSNSDGTYTTVVLAKSGTLAAGNYTIPENHKFLIPYNSSLDENFGDVTQTQVTETRSEFKKLALQSGATIICNGQICINAKQFVSSNQYTGYVTGGYGVMELNAGSKLELKSGATLYCYGFAIGDGAVIAESDSAIHELFQIQDWRGGKVAAAVYSTMKGESFLLSQYYFQNVEAQLEMKFGATLIAHVGIAAGSGGVKTPFSSTSTIIGNDGLFRLKDASGDVSDGVLIRKYDGSKDRITYSLYGNSEISSFVLEITGLTASPISLNSANYVMNVPSNFTINVEENAKLTISTDIKLLPDTILSIKTGGTVVVASGTEIILYDKEDWTNGNYTYQGDYYSIAFAKSKTYNRSLANSANLNVDGTLTVEDGGAIYSTNSTDSANNALTGTGTIIFQGTANTPRSTIREINGNRSSDLPKVPVVDLQAPLAGISSSTADYTHSMSYGLIYKAHDGFWYNYTISLNDAVIGYVAKGGVYTYKNSNACTVTATNASVTNNGDGAFAITSTGGDIVLTVSNHSFTEYEWDESKRAYVAYCNNGCDETDERELCISLASMTMANSLNMNFAFEKVSEDVLTGYYVVITKTDADGNVTSQTITVDNWKTTTISKKPYYYATFTGIAAKEMTDNIHVAIYNASGVRISNVWVDSVQAQAMRNLAKTNVTDKSKTMVVDMLNYGAAAQENFDYHTANLANSKLTKEQQGFATKSVTLEDNSSRPENYIANIYLKSNTQFMMAFSGISDSTTATVTYYKHHSTEETTFEFASSDFIQKVIDNVTYYVITLESTVVADGRQEIVCKLSDGTTVTDSIASYAARASDSTGKALYEMLMKYSDSAYAYFTEKYGA